MRKILALILLFGLVACKSKKLTADSPEKFQIERLAESLSGDNLQTIYPDAVITEGRDVFEEGTLERPYSILYPDTPDEILVIWQDERRDDIYQIYFENEGRWRSQSGIGIGTGYEELVGINEGPIDVYGFGWDYSGAVDFKDGKLADSNVRVFLSPVNTPPEKFYGDKIIEATPEEIQDLNLKVRALVYQGQDMDN